MGQVWMVAWIALIALSPLKGQTVAAGQSSLSSTFDPAHTPRFPVDDSKLKTPVRHSVLTPDQQASQQIFAPPRSPSPPPLPPRLQSSSELTGIRAPSLVSVSLADTPNPSFVGIVQTPQTILIPPSPSLASGPDDLLEVVNARITRFTKAGVATDTVDLLVWFQAQMATVCPTTGTAPTCILGDVSVRYDQIHGRFVMSLQGRDDTANTSYLMLSVSNGATYASGWKNWILDAKLDGTTQTQNFGDFPQIGFDDQAVYVSMLMYATFGNAFQYAKVRILKKADLYNPAATTLPYKDLISFKNQDNSQASTLIPVHTRGRLGVGPPGAFLINASDTGGANYLTMWRITDPTGTPAATRTTLTGTWPYGHPGAAAQFGTTTLLDTGLVFASMLKAIYREGTLYAAQNAANTDEPTTVLYYKIDVNSGKISAESRFINGNFFYPAFDVPATVGPAGDLPNKLIVGTTTSSTGALTYAGVTSMKAGEDVYRPAGDGLARYGEFFGASIDPVSGGMWATGEYAKAQIAGVSQYGTWISHFPWATSPTYVDVPSTSQFFDAINVMGLYQITKGCDTTLFCPGMATTRAAMSAFVIRSIYGETFTFPNTPFFTDVPANHPQFSYIQKLKQLGITQGCTATLFCPDDTITRSQAAVFVVRAKLSPLFGDNFTFPTTAYFTDVPSAHPQFKFVQKLRELGVTQGCGPASFCPDAPVAREQMAAFLVRAFLN